MPNSVAAPGLNSVRLEVLRQMTAFIKAEVIPANGYEHDLSQVVFRGRQLFGDQEPLPMVSILEGMDPDRGPDTVGEDGLQTDHWVLLVQGWVADDHDNPTDPAHNLLASVKQALAKIHKIVRARDFVGTPMENVAFMTIEPGVVRPPDNQSSKAYFWMRVIVKMIDELNTPFWSPP